MIRGMSCLTIIRSARGALPLLGVATSRRGDGLVACSALVCVALLGDTARVNPALSGKEH